MQPAALPPPRPSSMGVGTALVALLLVGGLVALGVVPRLRRQEAVRSTQAAARAPRRVLVAEVGRAPARVDLVLPGSTSPSQSTTLYAKTTGFLRKNLVDLGDHVKAGQVLAEIDAPESEEEIRVAAARLEEARMNAGLVRSNAERSAQLAQDGLVSATTAETDKARANSAAAAVKTTGAELDRLRTLHGYQRIVAPFDGVITRRGVDRGALVLPGSGPGATALFELSELDTLKVFVDVPQLLAPDVKLDMPVKVSLSGRPDATATGKVARTAGALDASTRTLRTEIHLPASDRVLSGSFVRVSFGVERAAPPLVIPAKALVVRKEGTLVLRVGKEGAIEVVKVAIGRDLGKELELVSGPAEGDRVVVNPPDDLGEGEHVEVVVPEPRDGGP